MSDSLLAPIARKLVWWQEVETTLADPRRLACQVMALGTWNDVLTTRRELGDDTFRAALQDAPPGVFDVRSWNFWHLVLGMTPTPPLPKRPFA